MEEDQGDFILIKEGSLLNFDENLNISAVEFRGKVTILVSEEPAGENVVTATANRDFIHRFFTS